MGMRFSILPTGASVLLIKGGNYRPKGEMTQEGGGNWIRRRKRKMTTQTHILKNKSVMRMERKHKLCPPKKYQSKYCTVHSFSVSQWDVTNF